MKIAENSLCCSRTFPRETQDAAKESQRHLEENFTNLSLSLERSL
uniref:Protein binding protein n=1 Tax=Rhizophora mucronata TaxID=61149 RepID=A0A2P2IP23_RHIMU